MNRLVINKNEFDEAVWQDKTEFTQDDYNVWLANVIEAIEASNKIYDSCDSNADTYILVDIINMLNNTEIELDKD